MQPYLGINQRHEFTENDIFWMLSVKNDSSHESVISLNANQLSLVREGFQTLYNTLKITAHHQTLAHSNTALFTFFLLSMAWRRSGRVPDLRSVGRGFESQPPHCRVQP